MFTKKLLNTSQILRGEANVSSSRDLFSIDGGGTRPVHECYFGEDSYLGLPSFIVPQDGDLDSFFADVATYYPTWSPISAHIHFYGETPTFKKPLSSRARSKTKSNSQQRNVTHLTNWSALAIAEAASVTLISSSSEQDPTYALCRRTLAFALARTAMLYPETFSEIVVEKWNILRSITGTDSNQVIVSTVTFISSMLRGTVDESASNSYSEVKSLLAEYLNRQINNKEFSSYLLEFHPHLITLVDGLSGDFDGRMETFSTIVEEVKANKRSEVIDAITLAYFADRILPGTMRYMKVLGRHLSTYPSLLIWYGFFSSISERYRSESVTVGIDRKIQRDIVSQFDPEMTPSADISIDEFKVLARGGLKSANLRSIQPRSVLVSLLPGIDVHARFMDESNSAQEGREGAFNSRRFEERDRLLSNLLSDAQRILRSTSVNEIRTYPKSKLRSPKD